MSPRHDLHGHKVKNNKHDLHGRDLYDSGRSVPDYIAVSFIMSLEVLPVRCDFIFQDISISSRAKRASVVFAQAISLTDTPIKIISIGSLAVEKHQLPYVLPTYRHIELVAGSYLVPVCASPSY